LAFQRYSCDSELEQGNVIGRRKLWDYSIIIICCLVDIMRVLTSIKKTYQFVNEMKERFDRKMGKKVLPERTESLDDIYDRLQRKNEQYFVSNSTEDKEKPTI
jgi:hypothetical protein